MLAEPGIFLIAHVPDESGKIVLKQNLNGPLFNLTASPLQSSWPLWFFTIKCWAKKCLHLSMLWSLSMWWRNGLHNWSFDYVCFPATKMKGNCECCEDLRMPQKCCVWRALGGNRCILLLHGLLTLTYQGWSWTCVYWQTCCSSSHAAGSPLSFLVVLSLDR